MQSPPRAWRFRNHDWRPLPLPRLMGILNVTPDSFSDGGTLVSVEEAVSRGLQLVSHGADLIDVGGESTRPGSEPVPVEEELRRVVPVIARLAPQVEVPISIDTSKAAVARAALDAGASVVNDITGLTGDPEMVPVCRDFAAGLVCMHMRGTPQTMQDDPRYEDVVAEIAEYFAQRLEDLDRCGIPAKRVLLDPGIGFGKTATHNLELLAATDRFHALGRPILIGHSRKRFLQAILGRPVEERNAGTIGVSIALAGFGVDYLRVHDVASVHDALLAWKTVRDHGTDHASAR